MERRDTLTVIIGTSGTGKSTHVAELLRRTDAELVRTETDRPRRGANDDDTHIFISTEEFTEKRDTGYYLGKGALHGFNYGLPHLPETDKPKIVLLRAPFVPAVWHQRPDAKVIQFEASTPTIVSRLEARGDHHRINPAELELEATMGRKFTSYIVSTDVPFDESFRQFEQFWRQFQQ